MKEKSTKSDENIRKTRTCPDCNILMESGYIFTPEGRILWNETSPNEKGNEYWKWEQKVKIGIGEGRFSSVQAYICKTCELFLIDQRAIHFTDMQYERRKMETWPDIHKLKAKLQIKWCPECNNQTSDESYCPKCGFELKSKQEQPKSSKHPLS